MEHEWWCAEGDDCACDEDGPCIGVCAGCEPDCPLLTLPPRELCPCASDPLAACDFSGGLGAPESMINRVPNRVLNHTE